MTTDPHSLENVVLCPVCDGLGERYESYPYKQQNRYEPEGMALQHRETCWLCDGQKHITREQQAEWELVQSYEVCPACSGKGGKRYWKWQESRKAFTFEPCKVCEGKCRASPAAIILHNQERRKLQVWGIGCTTVVVVGGLFIISQILTLLVRGTPILNCCPGAAPFIPVAIVFGSFVNRIQR